MPKQASYRVLFRLTKKDSAKLYTGNLVFTNGEPWLFLSNADAALHPDIQPMIKLDPSLLVEQYDSARKQTRYLYRGEVPPPPPESETPQ